MSDWSSDVCSSDLPLSLALVRGGAVAADPVVAGDRVYIPTGRVVATWDYTDPSAPIRVAISAPADGAINGIARHGDYLYASWRGYDGSAGVSTWSLADPDQDRKSVVSGKSVSVRVDLGGRSLINKKTNKTN